MNVFELFATLGLDKSEYESGLDDAESRGSSFGSKLGSALGKGVQVVGAAATAAVGAAATGISALTTQAVQAYGDYEQLVGGVEKIFGDSANTVMQNADEAFRTAGLSANEYMETVTGFSAALIQSLNGDTATAANLANQAIIDMSDNANTFGTDIGSIMNAYSGFSKQNYTMLDNLKLGYGGTKEEMERLLKDADALSDSFNLQTDASGALVYSYADIVEGIHIMQDSMNIAGTTSKEASTTISGSIGTMQGAWTNLIAGLGNSEANLSPLIENLVNSVIQVAENIEPVALQAIEGISKLIEGLAPVIAEKLPAMIEILMPSLASATIQLVNSLVSVLPTILSAIQEIIIAVIPVFMQMLPTVIDGVFQLIMGIVNWLGEGDNATTLVNGIVALVTQLVDQFSMILPVLLPAIVQIIADVATALTTPENTNMLIQSILTLIGALLVAIGESLPAILELIVNTTLNITETVAGWFGTAIEGVIGFFASIFEAVGSKLSEIWQKIVDFFQPLIDFATPILEAFRYLFETIFQAIGILVERALTAIKTTFTNIWNGIVNFVSPILTNIKNAVSNAFNALVNLVSTPLNNLKNKITEVFDGIKDKITGIADKAKTWGKDLIDNFVSGIKEKISSVTEAVTSVADKIKSLIGFSEPEDGPLSNFHTYAPDMIDLFTKGLYDNENKIVGAFNEILVPPELEGNIGAISGGAIFGGQNARPEYNQERMLADIISIVDEKLSNLELVVPVYIGGKKIDQQIVTANARNAVISGGR